MIPEFPNFKIVGLSDRVEIEAFTHRFPPYSNFNFVSLLCWGPAAVSWLHGNLAARFQDTPHDQPVYSFLGTNCIAETTTALLRLATAEGMEPVLRHVPEVTIMAGDPDFAACHTIVAEPESADYVLSVEAMSSLKLKRLRTKRRCWRRFHTTQPGHSLEELDLSCAVTRGEILAVCDVWQSLKALSGNGVATERAALERGLALDDQLGLVALGARLGRRLTAFTLNEALPSGWSLWHFAKADPGCATVGTWLDVESARWLHAKGCTYANIAEDLGLPGLRTSKRSWLPVKMMKKYRLSLCGS